jgi:putative acetyltransferase
MTGRAASGTHDVQITIATEPPRQADILRLIALSDDYMASLYPPESNHLLDIASLERPEVCFLVARGDGKVLGCGSYVAYDGYGEIKRMFVDPDARGLKIGVRLLETIERLAANAGLPLLRLETGIHQPEAIGLYRRFGYVEIEPFADYSPDPLSLFMEKRLS